MQLFVVRVATDDNIADLPSRREFRLLDDMGAVQLPAVLAPRYVDERAWTLLQDRWQL
jgi:hypothetical protein